ELGELHVGLRNALCETGDLVDLCDLHAAEPGRAALELPPEAESLRLDPQGAGVAVGERPLDPVELRRRRRGQDTNVLQYGIPIEGVLGHQSIMRSRPAGNMGRTSYLFPQ